MNFPEVLTLLNFLKSIPSDIFSTCITKKENSNEEREYKEKKAILCAFCNNTITDLSQIISVNGSHQHVFVNPYAVVFETVCFKKCYGCVVESHSSSEFSWFHGYSWRISCCNRCYHHIGWLFSLDSVGSSRSGSVDPSPGMIKSFLHSSFYCLILPNIIVP